MSKATILIVEDEAIVAADLAGMLGRLGYEISGTTGHGEEATSLARERRPDLVLMDIRLAGAMDGVEAAGIIRRELDLPVIFLTAHSDHATLARAKLSEPFGYLLKPFEELGLETHIEMALYKHRSERKLRQSRDELELRVEERTGELREAEQGLKESNETLERRVAERTAELQAANILLRDSRLAALNMMEDADIARRRAVEATAELRNEVTIRKQAEQAMRESELFYRQTLESIPGMVFTTRPDGYCDYQSQQWVDFTGVPMIEHLGDGWNKLLHPDDRPRAYAAWQVAVEGRAPYDLEYRVRRYDGEYEWFKVRGRPIRNTAGEIVRWFGTALNIDHLVKVQEALRESEERVRRKLDSILAPDDEDMGALDLADIIDAQPMQSLMDNFYKLTRMPMGMIDLKGKVLVGVGWQDVCTQFHRINPETCKNCIESDTLLSAGVPHGEFKLYKCKNNMWDVATPIMVGGRRFGNFFMGQFLFEDEPLDYEFFRSQARRYGFDEKEYIAALESVPRLSRESLASAMAYFMELAEMLSKLGYSNLKLARSMTERDTLMGSLKKAHNELEHRVEERTEELAHTVDTLQAEIVEREKADKALRVSEHKFRSLFEESKDMIYIMSADGRLLDVNPAGSELFGYAKEEFLALDIVDELFCDPVERERFLRTLSAEGYVQDFDLRMRKKGGEVLHVLKTATVVRTEQGEIAGYRGIIHDVTQRKSLEQQLIQSQKMESIGLLAGGVAHDFNNLLTAISGYGQIIQEQYAAGDEMLGMCIEQIVSATNRAVELTRNLLAFSRKQILNPYPLQVNDIVISISKLLVRMIGEDIEFGTQLSDQQLTVMADKGQIDQVLVNLATNARDAMPRGGRLLIGTEQAMLDGEAAQRLDLGKGGAYALITVADSGEGMDPETLEKIFEPFYTTKETGKGTGLGLSIIYGIIKQHNGAIAVMSEPGKGSTFTVYLPLVEAAATGEERVEETAAPARGAETLLLAEDDPMVRKYMNQILAMAGYTVITAKNGAEAVDLFNDNRDRIALVVCDVVMPKKNGKEVYDEIRAMNPAARFLFVSGYNDEIIHTKGILLEDFNLLTKPVNRQQLLAKLREMLE